MEWISRTCTFWLKMSDTDLKLQVPKTSQWMLVDTVTFPFADKANRSREIKKVACLSVSPRK